MKRKIRVAMRIMFNDPDEIGNFVKSSLEHWKYRRKEGLPFYLYMSWPESMGYHYLDFGNSHIPITPDFSIEEVLNEEKILGYSKN